VAPHPTFGDRLIELGEHPRKNSDPKEMAGSDNTLWKGHAMPSLTRLTRRYLAGELDAQEVAALSERLRRDPEARRAFARVLNGSLFFLPLMPLGVDKQQSLFLRMAMVRRTGFYGKPTQVLVRLGDFCGEVI
jgi:hypothetical protein